MSRADFQSAHEASDVDFERTSQHHTLGVGATQAAFGSHNHNGLVDADTEAGEQRQNLSTRLDTIEATLAELDFAGSTLGALKPRMHAYISSAQNITNATWNKVTAWTQVPALDNTLPGCADWAYSAGVWTIPEDGYYEISAQLHYNPNGTGVRVVSIWVNGSIVKQHNTATTSVSDGASAETTWKGNLDASDTFDIRAWQRSGTTLALIAGQYLGTVDAIKVSGQF